MITITQTDSPGNRLELKEISIIRAQIEDAYFAKRLEEPQDKKGKITHTVVSGDMLWKIAKANATTVAKIKEDNGLTDDLIVPGQKLKINGQEQTGNKISFERVKSAGIGDEIYIIVETKEARELEIDINVKQGKEKGIVNLDASLTVQQAGSDVAIVKCKVGDYCIEEDVSNADDFVDMAIAKIVLNPKDEKKQKFWVDALDKLEDKKTFLYLLVDAHSNTERYITYHGRNPDDEGKPDHATCPNQWLDMDGKWLGLTNGPSFPITPEQLLQIFPKSTETRRKEVAKAINNYSDEFEINNLNRMSHFLGQIGTETGQLKSLQENSNYSAENIYNTFLRKVTYPHPTSDGKYTFKYHDLIEGYNASLVCEYENPSNNSQKGYGHKRDVDNPIEVNKVNGLADWTYEEFKELYAIKTSYLNSTTLFDYVYGCRMANGKKSTKDGSDYYGVGFIHLTGKEKYIALNNKWKELYPDNPKDFMGNDISLLKTDVDVAIKASMIIWTHVQNGTNSQADMGNNDIAIVEVTKDVNGGNNGLAMRKGFTKKSYEVLK